MAQTVIRPPILKNHGDGYVMIDIEDFEIARRTLGERRAVQLPQSGHVVLRKADAAIIRAIPDERGTMNLIDTVYDRDDHAIIYVDNGLNDNGKAEVMFFLKRTLPLQTPAERHGAEITTPLR